MLREHNILPDSHVTNNTQSTWNPHSEIEEQSIVAIYHENNILWNL